MRSFARTLKSLDTFPKLDDTAPRVTSSVSGFGTMPQFKVIRLLI